MFGVNADGWLAVHHVAHQELIERAQLAAQRPVREPVGKPAQAPAPVAPVLSTAPVCC